MEFFKFLLRKFLNIPITIYFNFSTLPFKQAIKLPILVSYKTKIEQIRKGMIYIEGTISRAMIQIGIGGTNGVVAERKNYIRIGLSNAAKIIFKGSAIFSEGALISVDRGVLVLGKNFFANKNFYISCNKRIEFGDDVIIGYNVKMFDSDNHTIISPQGLKAGMKDIKIGNHVWIAAQVDILKGSFVGDNSIIAYRSLVCKHFTESNVLIGGAPANIIEHNINWDDNFSYDL